jgi:hypothetical protein
MEDAIQRSLGSKCPVPLFHDAKAAEEWYKSRKDGSATPMNQLYYTLTTWRDIQRILIPHLKSLGDPRSAVAAAAANADAALVSPAQHAVDILQSAAVYSNLAWNPDAVLNTLRYMFFHTRCGICVSVRGGKVAAFVPFGNEQYVNTWSDKIVFGGGDTLEQYVRRKAASTGKYPEAVLPLCKWWMNGGIMCNVMPPGVWGDAYLAALRGMLDATCARWAVPDVDFFINKRDYPVLKRDGSEPYARFSGDACLTREAYSTYAPIFSFYTGSETADLPMPTTEDWCAATGQSFPGSPYGVPAFDASLPLEAKKPMAVFRGSATGESGAQNARLMLVAVADPCLVDAGITAFNASRDKVVSASPEKIEVDFRPPSFLDVKASYMSLADQFSSFRYVIYVDGHAAASRYGTLMHSGCVILKTESMQTRDAGWLWMFPALHGGLVCKGCADIPDGASYMVIHSDYSNLSETVQFLNENVEQARRVAANAKAAAPSVDGITSYWRDVLTAVSLSGVTDRGTGAEWYSCADKQYA